MKKRTIYSQQSQELLSIFEQAGNNKVMCIPIDYAKETHMVLLCNGNGRILKKPFPVKNDLAGVDYLINQVLKSCKHRGIKTDHIFFGGEDTGSYADNFIQTLRGKGWLVAGVNARDAKSQRSNMQASTDRLDLIGIGKTLLNKRGNCCPAQSGHYLNLRNIFRHRRRLVQTKTSVKNRIHTAVDRLFPGFLNEKKSGIPPFSKAALHLMSDRFSATQIRRRRLNTLAKTLKQNGIQKPLCRAEKLKQYASTVLIPPSEYLHSLQLSLYQQVALYQCLEKSGTALEKEIASFLAQTQGAFLTSIKGIGIVLAAGVTGEIGDPFAQRSVNNLVSYGGIIPRVKQTGGPEKEAYTGKVRKRCNRILKDYLVPSASKMGLWGPPDLKQDYHRREINGQHADFGIARRYLRMALCMMKTSQVYIPQKLRTSDTKLLDRGGYYLKMWPHLRSKWKKAGVLEFSFASDKPLGVWRIICQQIYDIKLRLS